MGSRFLVGLDLGQARDPTAVVAVEQVWPGGGPAEYRVRDLRRWLGLSYVSVAGRMRALLAAPELAGAALVVDKTGVGAAVVDQVRAVGLDPVAVFIHGGERTVGAGKEWRVPKRELVGVLQVLFQAGRLKIAAGLELADTLGNELVNFKMTIDPATAHDSYAAWRERDHDDLVLALALACWYAEKARPVALPLVQGKARGWVAEDPARAGREVWTPGAGWGPARRRLEKGELPW